MRKQLNINPEMDKLARENGLGHWSCTDPIGCSSWLRSDGIVKWVGKINAPSQIDHDFSLIADILEFDKACPIGKDWQPTEIIIDKSPTANEFISAWRRLFSL